MDDRRKKKQFAWACEAVKKDMLALSATIRNNLGFQLWAVQKGEEPADFKPMKSVGPGVFEIRVRDENNKNTGRCFYVSKFGDTIYILHAFKKLSEKTASKDIELGKKRYEMVQDHIRRKGKMMDSNEKGKDEVEYFEGEKLFENLGFSKDESLALRMKAELYASILAEVRRRNATQHEISKILDTTQSRVSELLSGKIEGMSIEKLASFLEALSPNTQFQLFSDRRAEAAP